MTVVVLLLALAGVLLGVWRLPGPAGGGSVTVLIFITFIGLLLALFRQKLRGAVDALARGGRSSYQRTLREAADDMPAISDLPQLLNYLIETVKANLGAETAALFLRDEQGAYRIVRSYGTAKQQARTLLPDGPAADALSKYGLPGSAAGQGDPGRREQDTLLAGLRDALHAETVLPLIAQGEVLGVLALGRKARGEPYGASDRLALESFAQQAAIALKKAEEGEDAVIDRLTRLCSREQFLQRMKEALEGARRYEYPVTLLIVDIDDFTRINTRHGHAVGDLVLKETAGDLRAACRETDIVARYGPDEFAVLLHEASAEAGARVAERLRSRIERLKPEGIAVSVSIGVGHVGVAEMADFRNSSLVARAGQSLAEVRDSGGNRVGAAHKGP